MAVRGVQLAARRLWLQPCRVPCPPVVPQLPGAASGRQPLAGVPRRCARPVASWTRAADPAAQCSGTAQEEAEGHPDYLKLILNSKVYDMVRETPLQVAEKLSAGLGCQLLLKREDLQPVFSFKIRGAYNRMAQMSPEERQKGVVTCSAGNHAQGVAMSAERLQTTATIVMPKATPEIKWGNVKRLGGQVLLHGDTLEEAMAEAHRLQQERDLVFVHPYDDPFVIAGQGTVGQEVLRQLGSANLRAIFVCCGGGGLLAGIAAFVKRVRPEVGVYGVEPCDSAAMTRSLEAGRVTVLDDVGLFAEGVAVKKVGTESFRVCSGLVDGMILVNTDEICAAIKATFEDTRSIVEPAGALGVAGARKFIQASDVAKDDCFVAITSGANMDFNRLRFVSDRAMIGEGREAFLSVTIPETPGSFEKLYGHIYPRAVTEFSYRYSGGPSAQVYVAFAIQGADEVDEVVGSMAADSLQPYNLTNNELAKTHARFLVGGRAPKAGREFLYMFEFPERPGALKRFLEGLRSEWNISLFQYRNYGGDVGKVLVGLQVPAAKTAQDMEEFLSRLRSQGFASRDETESDIYKLFLS